MKRIAIVWGFCALLLCGSFAVLIVEDRQLGVPLPYSVPLAFAGTLLIASALFLAAQLIVARRPVRIVEPAPASPATPRARADVPRSAPEGVVLLDLSRFASLNGQRA